MGERLQNKVAIVTGAASGIGAATAERFAHEGAKVLAADRNAEGVQATVERIAAAGGEALGLHVSVQNEADVAAMIGTGLDAWGRIDILVNNAGVASGQSLHELTSDEFDRVLGINLKGPLLCCKHVLPVMLDQASGAIVNVASISATCGIPNQSIYAPSKSGLLQLTRQLAVEFADRNIRVNAVSPGTIETPLIGGPVHNPTHLTGALKWLWERHPISRFGKPIEVANAILFLASDEASFITGANLAVDGGYTAQ